MGCCVAKKKKEEKNEKKMRAALSAPNCGLFAKLCLNDSFYAILLGENISEALIKEKLANFEHSDVQTAVKFNK